MSNLSKGNIGENIINEISDNIKIIKKDIKKILKALKIKDNNDE